MILRKERDYETTSSEKQVDSAEGSTTHEAVTGEATDERGSAEPIVTGRVTDERSTKERGGLGEERVAEQPSTEAPPSEQSSFEAPSMAGSTTDESVTEGSAIEESVTEDEAALKRRIEELESLNRELSDRYVRLVAEFDNFRRRTRQNEDAVRAAAAEALVVDLLPVLDNLHLALDAAGDALQGPFGQGVNLISQQLTEVLSRHGLRLIVAQGKEFDPNTMEAVAMDEPSDEVPAGHVIEEYRRGYKLHEKLLRASQVKVAQAQ